MTRIKIHKLSALSELRFKKRKINKMRREGRNEDDNAKIKTDKDENRDRDGNKNCEAPPN